MKQGHMTKLEVWKVTKVQFLDHFVNKKVMTLHPPSQVTTCVFYVSKTSHHFGDL